jgi:autotransporter translocation and assembly factor TamB
VASTARLDGEITATGVVAGSVRRWSARGRATARDLIYEQTRVADAVVDFDASPETGSMEAMVDSLRYGNRRLTRADAEVVWAPEGGRFAGSGLGVGDQQIRLSGEFQRPRREGEPVRVGLSRLELATRDGTWAAAGPVEAAVGASGLQLDSLVLQSGDAGIRLAGTLPWHQPGGDTATAAMTLELDRVAVGELLRVTQTDTTIDGVVSGRLALSGTGLDPVLDGRVSARPFRYGGAVFDSARGVLRYDDRQLRGNLAGWTAARRTVTGSGAVPLDLALTPRDERLLDQPLTVRLRADSLPAGLLSFVMPGFHDVTGSVNGEVALRGTGSSPQLHGRLDLTDGSATFRPLRVHYRTMEVSAAMESGSTVRVDARLGTDRGLGHLAGTLDLSQPADPGFDLEVTATRFQASRRRDVVATVTGSARVAGHYTRPVVSGDLRIIEGEMNLDEIWRQFQMVHLDPSIFQMIDSATVAFRPPQEIPFLENMRITSTTVTADRGFWLRSRQLNVEVSGALDTEVDRQANNLQLTGTLQAVGGDYVFHVVQGVPARTFDIRSGTIEFVGTPGIDPNLDMEARYRVRRAQGDPIDVMASVTGTLQRPRVALSSDADLPLSESDLASYILFGRSGAELTQAQSDVVSHGIGLVRPVATGLLSAEIQRALVGTGLPIDHIAFTTPEYGFGQLERYWESRGLVGVFHNTQLEVGIDAGPDLSLVGSVRIPTDASDSPEGSSPWRMFGARVEWRFRPSWTTEFYVEDRFARLPSFGLAEIDDRKVWGLSLFRDWGY